MTVDIDEDRVIGGVLEREIESDGGLGDLLGRIGMGQPIWPLPEASQDVAMIAFVLKDAREQIEALKVQLVRARDAMVRGPHEFCGCASCTPFSNRSREMRITLGEILGLPPEPLVPDKSPP